MMPVWLKTGERLMATACSIDVSTTALPKATLTVPASGDIPGIRDLIQITSPHGSTQVYRVVSSTCSYGQTVALQLIGAADTLSDDVYDVAAEEAETLPAATWLARILAKQTTARWQLGTCAMTASVKIKTNYQDLWTLMESVRETRPGYWWTYDFATDPWTISLVQLSDEVVSEFRLSRNVESAQVSISDQDLCNRLIFTVSSSDGTSAVSTYTDAASAAKYGIRTRCTDIKEDDIPDGMTAAEYAAQELSRNAAPIVTIQISGADLSSLTGDTFDRITIGACCRAVLPDLGDPIMERVVGLSWPDALNEPMKVKVSLSTEAASFTGSLASARKVADAVKKGGGGGGGGAKADKDGWAKVLTDTIDAVDGTGIAELWQSGIQMTSHGGVRIFSLYQGLASLDSELVITNSSITAEVTRATAAENTLSGQISVQAGKIALVVSETAGGSVVNAASIVAAINSAGSSVVISANHIELDGETIATYLQSQDVAFDDCDIGGYFTYQTESVSWMSQTVVTGATITMPSISLTGNHNFATTDDQNTRIITHFEGKLVTGYTAGTASVTTDTINYLGTTNGGP